MKKRKFSAILALVMAFMLTMSSVAMAAAPGTQISNELTATITVTEDKQTEALNALNAIEITEMESEATAKMQAALESTDLGLDLEEYNNLTDGGRKQAVADYVCFVKFATGEFETVADVQSALDTGVATETNKMEFLRVLLGEKTEELESIITELKSDNETFLDFEDDKINSYYGKYGDNGDFVKVVEAQNEIFKDYLALGDEEKADANEAFIANDYDGSFVTVLGYLKTAVDAAMAAEYDVALEWALIDDIGEFDAEAESFTADSLNINVTAGEKAYIIVKAENEGDMVPRALNIISGINDADFEINAVLDFKYEAEGWKDTGYFSLDKKQALEYDSTGNYFWFGKDTNVERGYVFAEGEIHATVFELVPQKTGEFTPSIYMINMEEE